MKIRWIGAAVGLMALSAVIYAQQGEAGLVGKDAPAFDALSTAGKKVSLKSLTKDGPVFLVFWKEQCPHNPRASALFNEIHKAYGEKSRMVGLVTAGADGASKWQKQFGVEYPFLADGDKSIQGSYALPKSIVTIMVGKDGKVEKTFPGYGATEMAELNEAMAAAAGVPAKKLELVGAPARKTYG